MTNTIKHTGQQSFEFCALIYVLDLVQPKIKFHISHSTKVVTDLNLTRLLKITPQKNQKKKQKTKKTNKQTNNEKQRQKPSCNIGFPICQKL